MGCVLVCCGYPLGRPLTYRSDPVGTADPAPWAKIRRNLISFYRTYTNCKQDITRSGRFCVESGELRVNRKDDIYVAVGRCIRGLRLSYGGKGISQADLARAVNTTANTIRSE